MRNLIRYVAVGLAIGLMVSLVFTSWFFSVSYGRSRSLEHATPEILAQLLTLRSETRAALDTLAPALTRRSDELAAFGRHLSDAGTGFEALTEELDGGGGPTTGTAAAVTAEADYLAALGDLLGGDPFNISQSAIGEVLRRNDSAKALLARELQASGLQVSGTNPLAWDIDTALADLYQTSQELRRAATETDLRVTGRTQNSVTVAWRAPQVASWSGIWITAGDEEAVFVTGPSYRIDGLGPLQAIQVSGQLALGAGGRFRGPTTSRLEAVSGHPPYGAAWLGDQDFSAHFRVTSESDYNDIYVGQDDYGSISVTSSCSAGSCPASLTLSGYDIAFLSTSSGQLRVSGGEYVLTIPDVYMGYRVYDRCNYYGTRTIRFRVTDGAMANGVWTATELTGTVNHSSSSCGYYTAYVNSTFSATLFYGD